MKDATRPAIFKWRQTSPELILCAVRWYLRYSLSLRDVEELFAERGLAADHTTIWRWVQRYGPALEQRLRRQLKPTNKSWRVDETYIRVQGRWSYLYQAIDSTGATIDFLLSAWRDAAAAQRLFRRALSDPELAPNWWTPRLGCQSFIVKSFKFRGAAIAERRMAPPAVIEQFDVFKDRGAGRGARWPVALINQFRLQGGEKAFRHRVVPAITARLMLPTIPCSPAGAGSRGWRTGYAAIGMMD